MPVLNPTPAEMADTFTDACAIQRDTEPPDLAVEVIMACVDAQAARLGIGVRCSPAMAAQACRQADSPERAAAILVNGLKIKQAERNHRRIRNDLGTLRVAISRRPSHGRTQGRAARAATNGPTRGSRRSSERDDPDESDLAAALAERIEGADRRPDPDELDLAALLDDLAAFIRRYVFMGEAQAATVALWVAHCHVLEASRVTPYLSISSAEPGCGKTLLLEVLEMLVPRPWLTGRTTAAVLPRKIEKVRPTLLLDESDAGFGGDRDYAAALRGILNTGYKRSGRTTVCVGKGVGIGFADFSTFCPKVISGLGKLPDTIRERSIPIRLVKIAGDEHVEEFEEEEAAEVIRAAKLRDRLEAFSLCGGDQLAGKRPDRPAGLSPRTREIIRPLLAIADLAGGEWPQRARRALVELAGDGDPDEATIGVQLLGDIREVLNRREADRISTAELLGELHAMDERPWGEWRRGNPITPRGLAKLLKPYRIRTRTVRLKNDSTAKGLYREQLEDAFRRYIPLTPALRHNGLSKPDAGTFYPAHENLVPDRKPPQTAWTSDCAGVPDRKGVSAGNGPEPLGTPPEPTLEDAVLDPILAEQIRASVDGEWIDGTPTREGAA